MQSHQEDDQFVGNDEPFEQFMPNNIVNNFNSTAQEPKPVQFPSEKSVEPPSERVKQNELPNHLPLLTDKGGAQRSPMVPQIEVPKQQRKVQHSSASEHSVDDQSVRSGELRKQRNNFKQKIRQRNSIAMQQRKSPIQQDIANIIETIPFSICMAIVTIYALFGDDVRILAVNKDGDDVFFVLTIICMVMFTIEIVFTSIAKPEYIFNFYFFLDVLSTITMILDIGWITDTWFDGDITNASAIKSIGQASRAARKAGRVIRVIRLVRLVKLYKHARQQVERERQKKILQDLIRKAYKNQVEQQEQQQQIDIDQKQVNNSQGERLPSDNIQQQHQQQHFSNKSVDNNLNNSMMAGQSPGKSPGKSSSVHGMGGQQSDMVVESQVGANLSDLVMRRVITIILSILISIPLLSLDTYQEDISSYETGLYRIDEFRDKYEFRDAIMTKYVDFHREEKYPIFQINIIYNSSCCEYNYQSNLTLFGEQELDKSQYRFSDLQYYSSIINGNMRIYSAADLISDNKTNSILSIFQTIFVCIVLAVSALVFNKDVSDLVIDPIEGMMKKIEMIAQNPLEAANIEEQEALLLEELEKNQDVEKLRQKEEEKSMETYVLQRIIMKIGALLAVGFGEAGSEIIAENIKKGGAVDPMIPGKKMLAIFGFCDIRNFTDATEVLQKEVMIFVNEVAEIVHSTVDAYCGSANKNIGDAFLLVWKFDESDYHPDPTNPKVLMLRKEHHIQQKCDLAVLGFLKVITAVATSLKLEKYKKHPELNLRMKDYSVKMGFGLHLGWAIEGAIGSNFKIDASYLSPNVNMASRLEAATKQFGSLILISGVLQNQLSDKCKKHLRMIDNVTVKGSVQPVEIHTVDVSIKQLLANIEPNDKFDLSKLSSKDQKKSRVVNRYKRDQLKKDVLKGTIQVADQFTTDQELILARQPFTEEFYEVWQKGFELYIGGKWSDAQAIFQKTLTMIPDHKDGPSNTLLDVIRGFGGKAPHDWKGFRELTEK